MVEIIHHPADAAQARRLQPTLQNAVIKRPAQQQVAAVRRIHRGLRHQPHQLGSMQAHAFARGLATQRCHHLPQPAAPIVEQVHGDLGAAADLHAQRLHLVQAAA